MKRVMLGRATRAPRWIGHRHVVVDARLPEAIERRIVILQRAVRIARQRQHLRSEAAAVRCLLRLREGLNVDALEAVRAASSSIAIDRV